MEAKSLVSFLLIFAGGIGAGYLAFGGERAEVSLPVAVDGTPRTGSLVTAAASGSNALDETEVRRIVETYIMENAQVIMRSVDEYQRGGYTLQMEARAEPYLAVLQQPKDAGVVGDVAAEVKIIEFFDYQCPHCKANYTILKRLLAEDPTVALMPKYLPILGDGTANDMSLYAARAAEAARLQGKFASFHEALMASKLPLSREAIAQIAAEVGLDVPLLLRDLVSETVQRVIASTRAIADEIGISEAGTPGYIIGGKVMIGAAPDSYERLKAMIAAARSAD